MTPASRTLLRQDVMSAEGCRLKPYKDTVGKLTIGYGRNLEDVGISKLEAEVLLDHDLASAEMECRKAFAWFADLAETRQRVVVEMVFNLGLTRFCGFGKAIDAIKAKDYRLAAAELINSKWAKQVGRRAERLAQAMRG